MISTDFFFYMNILGEILVWLSIFIETLFCRQFYNFRIYHELYNDVIIMNL